MQTYRKCTAQRRQMHPLACKLLLSFPQSRCICALCNAVFASLFVTNAVITFYIWADMSCIDEQVHVRTDHAGRISHALQACNQVFILPTCYPPSSFVKNLWELPPITIPSLPRRQHTNAQHIPDTCTFRPRMHCAQAQILALRKANSLGANAVIGDAHARTLRTLPTSLPIG